MLVVFVAPMFSPAATQMIEAALAVPQVRLAVVCQQPLDALVSRLSRQLVGHWQVDDITDSVQLEWAVQSLWERHGPVDRCFGAYEQLQYPLAVVRERLGIPGLSSNAALLFRDKAKMKDELRAAGLPVARHALLSSMADARRFAAEVGFPLVVKPPAGAGALATARADNISELESLLVQHDANSYRPVLAEEFLQGMEHSLETVSIYGQAVWHSITRYAPTPLEVLENPWIQWTVLLPREVDAAEYDDIRDIGARALTTLGMTTGVTHCEWFRRVDGSVAISEIAARPPGAHMTTMMSRAGDYDFVQAWAHLLIHGSFTPPERKYAVGTAYLRGQGRGRVTRMEGLDIVQRELGSMICDSQIPEPGQYPTGSYEGEGFIMVRHEDTSVVQSAVMRIVSNVRVHLA